MPRLLRLVFRLIQRFRNSSDGSLSVSERLERLENSIDDLVHSVDELKTHAITSKVVLRTVGVSIGIASGVAGGAYSILSILQLLHK